MTATLPLLHIIFFLAMTFLPPGTNKFSVDIDGHHVVWEQQGSGWHADSAGHDGGTWSADHYDVTGLGKKTYVGGSVHVADADGKKTATLQGKPVTVLLTENTLTFSQEVGGVFNKPVVISFSKTEPAATTTESK